MTSFSSEPEDTLPRPPASSRESRPSASSQREETEREQEEEPNEGAEARGVLKPQPRPAPRRRLDRRIDTEPGDPEGTHVCAPTDA
ncbi:MAG: hypothetical protein H6831_05690 [Planctomycetes bacterium]|nr:hypothetical protein [Planctomycetota bacterium]MCB9903882.1 hypothetical protein [Planctomycetota bacterium]